MRKESDRRYRTLFLPAVFPLHFIFHEVFAPGTCVNRYRFKTKDFPKDIEVDHIFFDHARNAWAFILYHPSWDVVLFGGPGPEIVEVGMEVFVFSNDTIMTKIHNVDSWRDLPPLF